MIRKLLMLITGVFFLNGASAQTATAVNYHKDKPVQITYFLKNYNPEYASWFQKKLDRQAGFTEAEAATIMKRIGMGGSEPQGLAAVSNKAAVVSHYKMYEQYDFSRFGHHYTIVWIPFGENQHMPEGLRPTEQEGCVFILDGKYVFSGGKDDSGNALAIAGTPVPESAMAATGSSTSTATANTSGSGTTAGGVQYSTADMSSFGPQQLGCMAIYPSNGAAFMYIVPVRGQALGDKAAVAQKAYEITGLADRNYRYEWFAGADAVQLQNRFKKSMSVRIFNTYTIN